MSVSYPFVPELDRPRRLMHGATVVVCIATATAALLFSLQSANPHDPERVAVDWEFTGDAAPLRALPVPARFEEVTDRPGCTAFTEHIRCFTTYLDRRAALAYLRRTVGPAYIRGGGSSALGWTACGSNLGSPAVGGIGRDPVNAVRTGFGEWRFPRSGPEFGDRLVVGITLVNAPPCSG